MFTLDIYGNPTPLSIYLAKVDGSVLGCLDNIIEQETASLTINLNKQYELSFDVVYDEDQPNWFEFLQSGMYLFVDKIGLFKMTQPDIDESSDQEKKSIKAYSIDSELEDKKIILSINKGTKTSSEYLVNYDDGEEEVLLNPYTGIPYDWIVIYNTFPEQLTELQTKLNNNYYGTPNTDGDIIVSDADQLQEITDLITLIPRLKNRAIYTDNEDGSQDTSIIEYVTPSYNGEISRSVDTSISSGSFSYTLKIANVENCVDVLFEPITCDLKIYYDYTSNGETVSRVTTKRVNEPTITESVTYNSDGEIETYDYLYTLSDNIYNFENYLMSAIWIATGIEDLENVTITSLSATTTYKYSYSLTSGNVISAYTLSESFAGRVAALKQFYTKYRDQLSLLSIVLENTGWTVGDIYGVSNGDYTIANKKYQFDIDGTPYAFLTQSLSNASNCIVTFDLIHREVNITPIENVGNDTGIIMGYSSLVNSLRINTDEDRLATRLCVSGGNNLGIERVNFGSQYIEDLSYKMNAVDSNNNRIYVSDALAAKYNAYKTYREEQREDYIQLSKDYEDYGNQISEIENRVPNDALKNDWSTFTEAELQAALTNYKNLLATLITLYKNDYGKAGLNVDGSVKTSYMQRTMYWYDYVAYNNLIDEINFALEVFPNYNDQSYWTASQQTIYEEKVTAWETEWTLYGTIELQAKIDTYKQNMDLMLEKQEDTGNGEISSLVIRKNLSGYEIKTWSQLTTDEKTIYANNSLFYKYDDYMVYYNNMVAAQTYLNKLLEQVSALKALQTQAQSDRASIVSNVSFESYFTEEECTIIYRLIRDADYSNENILTTSIDSVSDKIDNMYELLLDAQNKVSETSRPQLRFSVEADNLLGLSDFEPFWDSFIPGNFILVQYKDNTYVKLRMVGYTFNPCLPSSDSLSITFSNYTRSKSEYNDWSDLLGNGSSVSSSSSSSSGSGSGGTYGESDDIDVTISNTLLSQLLNTETFGARVTNVILDTIDINSLYARIATFGYIKDINYNGENGSITNTTGSIINLRTGKLSFGGGKLLFDGTNLTVSGTVYATAGSFGRTNPFVISDYGLDGSVSEEASDATWTTESSVYSLLYNNAFRPQFQFEITRIDSSSIDDITLQSNQLDSAILTIMYQYTITTTVTAYGANDDGEASDDDKGDDGTTSGATSGSSSSSSTTTTTTTTDAVSKALDVSSITLTHVITNNGNTKTYTYRGEVDTNNVAIATYLKNNALTLSGLTEGTTTSSTYNEDGTLASTTTIAKSMTVLDATVTSTYSYKFANYVVYSHIGTNYLQYAGALTVKEGTVTLGETIIEKGLNVTKNVYLGSNTFIQGIMASNDYWRVLGGGQSDSGYLEIATADNGNEPIYVRQYSGVFSTVTRTLTLLDASGHTRLPGTLFTSKIQTTATYIELASSVVFTANDNYMGWTSNGSERRLRFANTGASVSHKHNSCLYGGNGSSETAIGCYDGKNSLSIWYYRDTDKTIRIRGWDGSCRVPVQSNNTAKKRVAYLSVGSSTKLYIKGQWGSSSYAGKNISGASSDIRLKENIHDCEVESALDLINQIKIRAFDWNDREEDTHQKIGFIADELELLDSKLAIGGGYDEQGDMDTKAVDTFYLLGYVVKAMQEMDKRLVEVENKLNKLI